MTKIGVAISFPGALSSSDLDYYRHCNKHCDKLIVLVPDRTISLILNGSILPIDQQEHIQILSALKEELISEVICMNQLDIAQYIEQNNATIYFYRRGQNKIKIGSEIDQLEVEIGISTSTNASAKARHNKTKSCFILNGTYKIDPVSTSEIFPLKRYLYHGRSLWGPNKYTAMEEYYQKLMSRGRKDIIKYAYRKYSRKGFTFPVKNKRPAKIDFNTTNGCGRDTARCKFLSKKGYMTPICCATHIVEILFYVTDILEKHGITYFIYWGTLLGSLRHGGLIPWDSDADLYILESDHDKVIALEPEFNKKYFMSTVDKNFMRVNYSEKNRTHLDIYIANIIFQ